MSGFLKKKERERVLGLSVTRKGKKVFKNMLGLNENKRKHKQTTIVNENMTYKQICTYIKYNNKKRANNNTWKLV